MRIEIHDTKGEKVFDGELSHVEGGIVDGKPSFHISCYQKLKGEAEVHFYMDNFQEFEELVENIKNACVDREEEKY